MSGAALGALGNPATVLEVGRGGSEGRLESEIQKAIVDEWHATTKMPQNPPLTRRGRQQGKELGEALIGKGISHIYCSPFLR